jgi:AcrR family transcriptional regulator
VRRTRAALVAAFNELALGHRKRISVADIVARADVGRSTFYAHYRGADDIRLEAMSRPLAGLADAAAGIGDEARMAGLIAHFWENRALARDTFAGRMQGKVTRLLADMIEARLGEGPLALPSRLAALQLAEAALAPLRGWVAAEAPCAAAAMAGALCRSGRALRASLTA